MHKALIYSAVNDTSPCVREHIFSKQNYTSDAFGCLEITTVTDSPRLCLLAFFSLSVILFIYLNNCLFILFWGGFFAYAEVSTAQQQGLELPGSPVSGCQAGCRSIPLGDSVVFRIHTVKWWEVLNLVRTVIIVWRKMSPRIITRKTAYKLHFLFRKKKKKKSPMSLKCAKNGTWIHTSNMLIIMLSPQENQVFNWG